ncbi:hypothetical protein BofuT4_uP091910.1 [Botrytis cinerea T4]|uniref:Uncharacterized protein n=1 Tax=Botryotinia fuckeliana (strain T4) TaxID=999810 RepID=G2YEN4_BOTF4|nr:hypothetical protein BofuT4_uP091910.1 [Botrytis cinerea T4]
MPFPDIATKRHSKMRSRPEVMAVGSAVKFADVGCRDVLGLGVLYSIGLNCAWVERDD